MQTSDKPIILGLNGLSVAFGKSQPVLDTVSWEIRQGEGLALDSSELPGQYRLAYYSASAALASAPVGLVLGEGIKSAYRPSPQTLSEFPDALAFIELLAGSYILADGAEVVGKPEVTKIQVLAKGEDPGALDPTILQIRSGEKIDLKVKPTMKGAISRLP
jgi:hypothetical protein